MKSDGDRWIVTKGLETGDRVVVAGFQKAAVGAPVAPEEQGALPGPAVKAEAATAN